MPTEKPRVQLTLPPERHALLKRLAALQGVSMAALVTDMLEEFYPVMERVTVVLEAARQAQETSKQGLRDAVAQAEAELLPLARATLSQFDLFMDQVEGSVTGGAPGRGEMDGRPRRPPAAPARKPPKASRGGPGTEGNPRVVTRGSGMKKPHPSNAPKAAGKPRGTRSSAK